MLLSTSSNRSNTHTIALQILTTTTLIIIQYTIATSNDTIHQFLIQFGDHINAQDGIPIPYGETENFLQGFMAHAGTIPIIMLTVIGVIQNRLTHGTRTIIAHTIIAVIVGTLIGFCLTYIKPEANIGVAIFASLLFETKKIVW